MQNETNTHEGLRGEAVFPSTMWRRYCMSGAFLLPDTKMLHQSSNRTSRARRTRNVSPGGGGNPPYSNFTPTHFVLSRDWASQTKCNTFANLQDWIEGVRLGSGGKDHGLNPTPGSTRSLVVCLFPSLCFGV